MKIPFLSRAMALPLFCWFACISVVRAEQITISLGMSFDKVVEAIQGCSGKDDGAATNPLGAGHKWTFPDSFGVTVELGEHYGKLNYLMYHPLGETGCVPTAVDPYAYRPLQSLTFDTETHQAKGEWLPPGSPVPVQNQRWQVRVELLVVTLPQERALALLPDLRDETKIDAAYMQIMAAIQRKEAQLLGYPVIVMPSGQKATSETILEKIYPTQFNPPQGPQSPGASDPKPGEPAAPFAIPTAFEKRNTGITLEVEPIVQEGGKWIDLNIQPQRVDFDGMDAYPFYKGPTGDRQIEQPRFYVTKESFSITVRHGQRVLVGFHKSLRGDEAELHLIQATITPVP